jgi:hypothetical protein
MERDFCGLDATDRVVQIPTEALQEAMPLPVVSVMLVGSKQLL